MYRAFMNFKSTKRYNANAKIINTYNCQISLRYRPHEGMRVSGCMFANNWARYSTHKLDAEAPKSGWLESKDRNQNKLKEFKSRKYDSTHEANEMLEELEEMVDEGRHGQGVLIEAMSLYNTAVRNSIIQHETTSNYYNQEVKLTKKQASEIMKQKYSDLEKAGKERSLTANLISYLELCVATGLLNRACSTLSLYLQRKDVELRDVKIFNVAMEGYAKNGNIDKLLELWKTMKDHSIKPSPKTYALRIEAASRSFKKNKMELIQSALWDMHEEKMSLNDLFTQSSWRGDSREVVLQGVKAIKPNFQHTVPKPDILYKNSLLNHLNKVDKSKLKSPARNMIILNELNIKLNEQLKTEESLHIDVKSIEKEPECTELLLQYRQKLEALKYKWESSILAAFSRDLNSLNKMQRNVIINSRHLNIYPYLVSLDKHDFKDIVMQEIRRLAEGSETFSPPASQLYSALGHQVKTKYEAKLKCEPHLLNKLKNIYSDYFDWYLMPNKYEYGNARQCWQMLKYNNPKGPCIDNEPEHWPSTVLVSIGKFLYNIILRDIKIDVNVLRPNSTTEHLLPAFYSVFRHQRNSIKSEIKPHPIISKIFRVSCNPYLSFNILDIPMLCPPMPWSSLHSGGHILAKTCLIRLPHQAIQQIDIIKNAPQSQLYPCFDSLNQLSSIPWKVNKEVLDIVINVFNNGGSSKLDIPEPPTICPMPEPLSSAISKTERFQEYKKRMVLRRKRAEMYSLWCDALYRLSLANHFRDKIFWLPHNMDFRGRVYPCPPHLNHLGSDMSRSLLKFAKEEPLGPTGLDWLKIHLINLTGLKKRVSNKERLSYAEEILPKIIDSGENPLNGQKWWMESEEPWQTLACCIEIKNALSCNEGPENYISSFPVHQDGSCNGLQHYAALGRDKAGAYSVNLAPCDTPQDVYSCVAALVERERAIDASNGIPIAIALDGFIKRKVIKQTVMTTVYGVTRFGARLQIAKQLKDIENFPKDSIWPASTYLVTKTFSSLREMFTSTKEIQDWFTETAKLIAQVCGQNVEYVTPIGLPVVQPYSRPLKSQDKKNKNDIKEFYSMDLYEKPNIMKQKNAFPPNFIHSLDSTHMMLTSLHCEREALTFVSVHDCYWTHPKTLPLMNKICREQFVALHKQPIIDELASYLSQRFATDQMPVLNKQKLILLLRKLPAKGNFDLSNVLDSEYFFS